MVLEGASISTGKRWRTSYKPSPMATLLIKQGSLSKTGLDGQSPGGAIRQAQQAPAKEETGGRRAPVSTATGPGIAGPHETFHFGIAGVCLLSCCFGAGMCGVEEAAGSRSDSKRIPAVWCRLPLGYRTAESLFPHAHPHAHPHACHSGHAQTGAAQFVLGARAAPSNRGIACFLGTLGWERVVSPVGFAGAFLHKSG